MTTMIEEGAAVAVLMATDRGARWATGTLALAWPGPDGDTGVYLNDDARFGDYDPAPPMVYPVDVLRVEEVARCR